MDRKPTFFALAIAALLLALAGLAGCEGYEARKAAHLKKGQELYDQGSIKKSELEFRNVLQIDPKHAESWFMLAKIADPSGSVTAADQTDP